MDNNLTYVHIESSTLCSGTCKMCPHSTIKRRGIMDYSLFTRIVDQAQGVGCNAFTLFRVGEPLLFPELFRWLDYMKLRQAKVSIYTNASNLTPEIGKRLQDYREIYCDFTISFHGIDAESYRNMMGLDFDRTYMNIASFMEYNEIPANIYMLANDPGDPELIAKFKSLWEGMAFHGVALCHFMEWAGNITGFRTLKTMHEEEGVNMVKEPCFRSLHELDVMYDGTAVLCCVDAHGEITFGDLNHDSMEEVLNHKLRLYYQRKHLASESSELPLCGKCGINLRSV